jgi:hypothetical protein
MRQCKKEHCRTLRKMLKAEEKLLMTEYMYHYSWILYGVGIVIFAGLGFVSLMYRNLLFMGLGFVILMASVILADPKVSGKTVFKISEVPEYFTVHDKIKLVKDGVSIGHEYLVSYGEYEERSLVTCIPGDKEDTPCTRSRNLMPDTIKTVDQANTYLKAMAEKHKEKSSFLDDYFWLLILLIVLLLLMLM